MISYIFINVRIVILVSVVKISFNKKNFQILIICQSVVKDGISQILIFLYIIIIFLTIYHYLYYIFINIIIIILYHLFYIIVASVVNDRFNQT